MDATAKIFNGAIADNDIPAEMLQSLQNDVFVFSALRTHAQLFEASRQLLTDDGKVKPFYQFSQDVATIKKDYNQTYLEAEYQFAVTSAQMAGKWAQVSNDYDLQYRTAGDERVRATHAALNAITLPADDAFWLSYYPPNGWRCRCNAVQVRKGKFDASNSGDAIAKGEAATYQEGKDGKNRLEIFRFNPGAQKVIFPPSHPYSKVTGADVVKKDIADTSKYDAKVFRYIGTSAEEVEESNFYKLAKEKAANIRPAEALGINRYTSIEYASMNKYLRAGKKPMKGTLDALIEVTNSGLDKLPKYEGTTYRGADLGSAIIKRYEEAFTSGKPFTEIAYMSTTTDITKKFDGNVLFMLQGKNGVPVKVLSQFPGEEEVLFKPGTQFKIKSFVNNEAKYEIIMEEI